MLFDVHSHAVPPAVLHDMAKGKWPMFGVEEDGAGYRVKGYGRLERGLYDAEVRQGDLASAGISGQVFGPPPPFLAHGNYCIGSELAAYLNSANASWASLSGQEWLPLAIPALDDPAKAAGFLKDMVERHGFRGVAMPTAAGAASLDNPEFRPLWQTIDDLGLVVFLHAASGETPVLAKDYSLETLVTWPTLVTYAAARLIFSGLFVSHPDLKLILSHGGGSLPALIGRIDLGYFAPEHEHNPACSANIPDRPSSYLRNFHFDTCVGGAPALPALVAAVGTDRVVFGSDYPYEIGDSNAALATAAMPGLMANLEPGIANVTARNLFGLSG